MVGQRLLSLLIVTTLVGACELARTDGSAARTDSTAANAAIVRLPAPADSEIPDGPLGASIRRGRALLAATPDSLPQHVGGQLRCTSCHLDDGTRVNAAPLVGVYARFPQYRDRSNSVAIIQDRVNDCFERSMNGRALPFESRDMRDIVAWLAFLSRGTPVQRDSTPHGIPLLAAMVPDTARGRAEFVTTCAACHGLDGQGTPAGPPLWGPKSYNVGASMARLRTAASFIKYNMPNDRPGALSEQQAFDLAAYVNSHSRPDLAGKENDWPKGNAPADVPYATRAKAQTVDGGR
jgi:thiosulfate dehydrogenase